MHLTSAHMPASSAGVCNLQHGHCNWRYVSVPVKIIKLVSFNRTDGIEAFTAENSLSRCGVDRPSAEVKGTSSPSLTGASALNTLLSAAVTLVFQQPWITTRI